jgi:hypothetical protein
MPYRLFGAGFAIGCLANACSPELVVGKVTIEEKNEACLQQGEGGAPSFEEKVVELPWSTGFENGFSDYYDALGICYVNGRASCGTVTSPAFEGKNAAAFTVTASPPGPSQTRCYLEGRFPVDAVYGAWFFIPALAEVGVWWNLMFFQGVVPPTQEPALWSVSLRNAPDGGLRLFLHAHAPLTVPASNPSIPVPIGRWFRVEFRLARALDATGAIALYQDGVPIVEATGLVTDRFDFHHWYVGNWGDGLTPAESTVYVDDVTIRAEVGQ